MSALQELFDRLDRHDWYYQMSDDHRCWVAGEADNKAINEMAANITGGPELKSAFCKHYYTGEPWGNEKQPKPTRPADEPAFTITVASKRSTGADYIAEGEYIGRPSVLGNPFTIGTDGTRDEVIAKYREWLWQKIKDTGDEVVELQRLADLARKGDLTLVCWCAPEACHGDVIKACINWLNEGAQS